MHIGDEISRICSTTKTFAKFLPTSNNEETQDMSLHLKSYLFLPKQSLSKHTPNNQKLHLAKISEFLTTITEFAKNLILWEICKFSKQQNPLSSKEHISQRISPSYHTQLMIKSALIFLVNKISEFGQESRGVCRVHSSEPPYDLKGM